MRENELPLKPLLQPAATRCPHRHLAAAVVGQAVRDFLSGPEWYSKSRNFRRPRGTYTSAAEFLFKTDMHPWIDLLDIDVEFIREKCLRPFRERWISEAPVFLQHTFPPAP